MSNMSKLMNTLEDLAWAREVHDLPLDAKSFVLYGNEDCPDKIEWYTTAEPLHTDVPNVLAHHEELPDMNEEPDLGISDDNWACGTLEVD